MERRQDFVLGVSFAALGLYAALASMAYSGATGTYPMVLGIALAAFGLLIAIRAGYRRRSGDRPLTLHAGRALLTVVLAAVYLWLVPIVGFYTASGLVVLALPIGLGFRRPVFLAAATASFVALVWLVFSILLEKPLPREIWTMLN